MDEENTSPWYTDSIRLDNETGLWHRVSKREFLNELGYFQSVKSLSCIETFEIPIVEEGKNTGLAIVFIQLKLRGTIILLGQQIMPATDDLDDDYPMLGLELGE